MRNKKDGYHHFKWLSCKIFGHTIVGYQDGLPYLKQGLPSRQDNTGRTHIPLYGQCDCCHEDVRIAYIYGAKL